MLKDYLRGSSSAPQEEEAPKKASSRMVVEAETPLNEAEAREERRRAVAEQKMAEIVEQGPAQPKRMVAYDSLFQHVQEILMEDGRGNEFKEGVQINVSRRAMNAMISPNMSEWEVNLQMNGFTDILAATWSTSNRYQLIYQNVSSLGSLFVAQVFAQTKGPATQGSLFTMFQYPWWFGGCSQIQYLKGQNFSLSHTQRLIRGKNVDLAHALSIATHKKNTIMVGEIHPLKGTWKISAAMREWGNSSKGVAELEYKETEDGQKASALKLGFQRAFVGGANITTSLINFDAVNIDVHLPFGGSIQGLNQFKMQLKCKYDLRSGGLKHNLVLTA
eukprot:gene6168-4446_t